MTSNVASGICHDYVETRLPADPRPLNRSPTVSGRLEDRAGDRAGSRWRGQRSARHRRQSPHCRHLDIKHRAAMGNDRGRRSARLRERVLIRVDPYRVCG